MERDGQQCLIISALCSKRQCFQGFNSIHMFCHHLHHLCSINLTHHLTCVNNYLSDLFFIILLINKKMSYDYSKIKKQKFTIFTYF